MHHSKYLRAYVFAIILSFAYYLFFIFYIFFLILLCAPVVLFVQSFLLLRNFPGLVAGTEFYLAVSCKILNLFVYTTLSAIGILLFFCWIYSVNRPNSKPEEMLSNLCRAAPLLLLIAHSGRSAAYAGRKNVFENIGFLQYNLSRGV